MELEIDKINTLPHGSKVAIDGAGECGKLLKQTIEKKRPDIKISCFFDAVTIGEFEGIIIYPIEDIKKYMDIFDVVLVASYSNASVMSAVLSCLGVDNHIVVTGFKKYKYNDYINSSLIYRNVRKKLNSKESKKVWQLIVKGYFCKHCFENLVKYLKKEAKKSYPQVREQYFDFINKDAIKTVISGGVYDGGSSILFLKKLNNLQNLYGFEPLYKDFKIDIQDKIIRDSGKIEIIEKGLFDKSTKLSFGKYDSGSRISESLKIPLETIQTISIDEFIKERNIKKVDFIKMDIEGSELSALKGAEKTILRDRPQMAISIYHSSTDLYTIPFYLYDLLENYKYEVYHYDWNNNFESIFYAIPDELYIAKK